MSNSSSFNPDRDILISLRPAGVLVHGIRSDAPITFDDLAAAESFLLHDVEALECAEAGAALFFVTFEQPGDIFEHEIESDECPDCSARPGGHGLCVTCCDGWDEYRDDSYRLERRAS